MRGGLTRRIVQDEYGMMSCPDCGSILSDVRSRKHHGAFFAFLHWCTHNWPETVEFQPDNREHLRAWALVKANHRAPARVYEFKHERERQMVMPVIMRDLEDDRREGRYAWIVPYNGGGGGVVKLRPASLNWEKLGQRDFNRVSADVFQVLRDYAGLDFEAWKAMRTASDLDQRRAA